MSDSGVDQHWMHRAIELAQMGVGLTSPNPPVGAVIVKNGIVLGEGYHQGAGLPHAEREAIADALKRGNANQLPGSTIYVTLEPCSTCGRTPPCTDAIAENKIAKVIFGAKDPNPVNANKAFHILNRHGIQVTSGILEHECIKLIRGFMMAFTSNRPWIMAKTAMTLDGRNTRPRGVRPWFTGEESRREVHTLRSLSDAILVGGNTIRQDDPALTVRTPNRPVSALKKQPWRIVMTRDKDSLPETSQCFTDQFNERTVVMEDVQDLHSMLKSLVNDYGVHFLMLECGGRLLRRFLELEVVDEWIGFYAPMITGGPSLSVAGNFLTNGATLKHVEYVQFGDDLCVKGMVSY